MNKETKIDYLKMKKSYYELIEIIDKAIEYIENIDEDDFIETEHYIELLTILHGDINE